MAMLQHVHDQAEDMGQAAPLKVQLRDLRDDKDLMETLHKSVEEVESWNAKDLASLKEKLSWVEEELAREKEKSADLDAEKVKLEGDISSLKAHAVFDNFALMALRSELQGKTVQL
jgi:SPX domain protein involved in polyphosphate accumulation